MEYDQEFLLARIIAKKAVGIITQEEQSVLDQWVARSVLHAGMLEKFLGGEGGEYETDPEVTIRKAGIKYRKYRRRRIAVRLMSTAAVFVLGAIRR